MLVSLLSQCSPNRISKPNKIFLLFMSLFSKKAGDLLDYHRVSQIKLNWFSKEEVFRSLSVAEQGNIVLSKSAEWKDINKLIEALIFLILEEIKDNWIIPEEFRGFIPYLRSYWWIDNNLDVLINFFVFGKWNQELDFCILCLEYNLWNLATFSLKTREITLDDVFDFLMWEITLDDIFPDRNEKTNW